MANHVETAGSGGRRAHAAGGTWPELPLESWQDTCATLHMWTQIVGKIRLKQLPLINHWWQVTFYVTARGLTTGPMPDGGTRTFQIDFDFIDHALVIATSDGQERRLRLKPQTVAEFYTAVMDALGELGIPMRIWPQPQEVPEPIRFDRDHTHGAYAAAAAQRFWRILVQADRVFTAFRSRFMGKSSPVHFFWGSMDLAVTRFSGRPAPPHPGAPGVSDRVTREAYSHEVSSAGFWPGTPGLSGPAFYAYAYPEPPGFKEARVQPKDAYYDLKMGEFLLPYEAVAHAERPDDTLMAFLESTYAAAADLANWDRAALERPSSSSSSVRTAGR